METGPHLDVQNNPEEWFQVAAPDAGTQTRAPKPVPPPPYDFSKQPLTFPRLLPHPQNQHEEHFVWCPAYMERVYAEPGTGTHKNVKPEGPLGDSGPQASDS